MLLSLIILFPLICALVMALLPDRRYLHKVALGMSVVEFLVGLVLYLKFDHNKTGLQFVEKILWIEDFGISYFLGVDGISIWLVLLTVFLQPIVVLASWSSINEKIKGYYVALFLLESAMIGSFITFDAVLFYLFWELSLVPMYFIIGLWGGERKIYATLKFFIYTMAGSIMMLVANGVMLLLAKETLGFYTTSLLDWYKIRIPFVGGEFFSPQTLLFFAYALAFAVKTPVFPFHTWLPDAHVQAPTAGSVILAGVMLKMGTYSFLRWVVPLFPEATQYWSWLFIVIGITGIIYGALMALVQNDIKKVIAYSSVSHMGYIIAGIFSLNELAMSGALYQMLNHGISTGALFLLVGMIYERTHTRDIVKYGGIAAQVPIYTVIFMIVTFSSIAVPLTNGFVGEFLILLGIYQNRPAWAAWAVAGVILGAGYMLWTVKRVFFGPAGQVVQDHGLHDLSQREILVMLPLVFLVFFMGIYPNYFLRLFEKGIIFLVENFHNYQLFSQITEGGL
ncbi:MAG: NADH-quinone oxidoreductase subunit M [Bdellovibrionaceae bacterium]|nr:NADH-quinone oxidoreductase subunit M [Pseudobdellovibrionaceae bacterium]MDW8189375.1 NADH-quinone oxidoreductase subunit M [Pseudobdellovibrionaceae bacterium]